MADIKINGVTPTAIYVGSTAASAVYYGNVKVWESAVQLPAYTLRYQFHTSGFDPTTLTGGKGTWTQVSSSPNVWDWTYQVVGGDTDWSFGPFATTQSEASSVHLTGTYDVIAAGDNTGVTDMQYFFGIYSTENPTGCDTNGPVNVCDLHIRPTSVASLFRWCPTLEYFEGNIDIGQCEIFSSMFSHTSITTLPPFTGTQIITAGTGNAVSFQYLVNGCQSLTSVANLNTLDLRYDDLSAMAPNDGITFNGAFYDTPNLSFTGHETDSWHANAVPIRIFSYVPGSSATGTMPLSSNKVNLFKWRNRNACQFKYLFYGAGLTTVPDFTDFNLTGCDFTGCFNGNTNVTSGALAAYTKLSSLTGTVGTGCFTDCGSNTVSGTADLDQIPQSWGGNFVVQDYYLGTNWSKAYNSSSNGTILSCTSNFDFNSNGTFASMQIYTEASVSAYAGVNMRKSNIGHIKGTFDNTAACYYWPCLFQFDYGTTDIEWYMRTQNYNGMLTASETQGDMPGILDVSTLGAVTPSSSSMTAFYDPEQPTYFGFVVTNTASPSNLDIMRNSGILYNNNIKTDPVIRVVKSTLNPANSYIGQ